MSIHIEKSYSVYFYTDSVSNRVSHVSGLYSVNPDYNNGKKVIHSGMRHALGNLNGKIVAIKYLRDCNVNMGLKDAKDIVEAFFAEHRDIFGEFLPPASWSKF